MKKQALLLLALAFLSSCSVDGSGEPKPTFIYHPADRLLPFPSDRYLVKGASESSTAEKASGYRIDVSKYAELDPATARFPGVAEGLSDLDGFGTSAEIAVALTASPAIERLTDEAIAFEESVKVDSPIILTSIAEGDKQAGKPLPFVARIETDGKVLFLRPWIPLKPNGWYAVIFRDNLRDVTGREYESPAGFVENYEDGEGEGLEGEGYRRLRAVTNADAVFAVTFRTGSIRTKLLSLVEEVRSAAPPPVSFTTRAPGAGNSDLSLIVDGWIKHRNYRNADGKLEDKLVNEEWIPFTVTLPKVGGDIHEPFPVVLGQHGLNDKRQAVMNLADGFARQGLATVAIDAPNHGARGPGDGKSYDTLRGARETLGVWTDGKDITFRSWQFRDLIRQQVLDHLQVLKAMSVWQEDLARAGNEPGADLKGSETFYTGQSMGGIMGGVSGSVLTELQRVVLNVPGGRISNILVRNEVLGGFLIEALRPRTITMADAYRMVALVQATIDPGDPINYVELMVEDPIDAPRPLLIQAAFKDATLPNFASYDLARAAGAPFIGPFEHPIPGLPMQSIPAAGFDSPEARAFALFRDIIDEGAETIADHGNLWASKTALDQAALFLKTGVIKAP